MLALFPRTDGGTAGNDNGPTCSLLPPLILLALHASTEISNVGNGIGQNSRPLRHRPRTPGQLPLLAPFTNTEGSCVGNGMKQNSELLPYRQKVQSLLPLLALFTRTDGGTAGDDIGQTCSLLPPLTLLALHTSTDSSIVGNGTGQNRRPLRHCPKTQGRYRPAAPDDADEGPSHKH